VGLSAVKWVAEAVPLEAQICAQASTALYHRLYAQHLQHSLNLSPRTREIPFELEGRRRGCNMIDDTQLEIRDIYIPCAMNFEPGETL
jgi:hypothetical protein